MRPRLTPYRPPTSSPLTHVSKLCTRPSAFQVQYASIISGTIQVPPWPSRGVLAQVKPGETLGLVAYKEQFLLYLDRPAVNFGHRRWQEGPLESYDAALWINAAPGRILLVPESTLKKYPCFLVSVTPAGRSSDEEWFLVRPPACFPRLAIERGPQLVRRRLRLVNE